MYSLEYTGEEGVQTEAETKPFQQALAAGPQGAQAKLENLTPENLNPENLNSENLNPENLNKEYAPLNQHSETQEEFTIQYKPGEGVFDQFRYVIVHHVVLIFTHLHSTLYIVNCTLYIVHCILTLYIVYCTLYIVYCTLYNIYSETLNNKYIERIHQMSYSSLSDNGMLQIFSFVN